MDIVRKKVKLDYNKQTATLLKQPLPEKIELEQSTFKFLARVDSIKTSIKSVENNAKKNKKLLGGYEKLIKTKTD